jgi:hypothetical protein
VCDGLSGEGCDENYYEDGDYPDDNGGLSDYKRRKGGSVQLRIN